MVSVTLNGTSTKSKKIKTNCWLGLFRISGLYDWVSKDYGNMGLIIPIDLEDEEDPILKYNWVIIQNPNSTNISNEGTKPYFVNTSSNETNKFTSNLNQAVVNWGSSSNSYLISCYGVSLSGKEFLINENYVDVGDPKNNPCFKNAIYTTVAPNPIHDGKINVILNKPSLTSPCNYKDLSEPQYFNSELDEINNSVTIYDYNGTEVYRKVFESNEFIIDDAILLSGSNYIINLYTKEGGFTQQVIIIE